MNPYTKELPYQKTIDKKRQNALQTASGVASLKNISSLGANSAVLSVQI